MDIVMLQAPEGKSSPFGHQEGGVSEAHYEAAPDGTRFMIFPYIN